MSCGLRRGEHATLISNFTATSRGRLVAPNGWEVFRITAQVDAQYGGKTHVTRQAWTRTTQEVKAVDTGKVWKSVEKEYGKSVEKEYVGRPVPRCSGRILNKAT